MTRAFSRICRRDALALVFALVGGLAAPVVAEAPKFAPTPVPRPTILPPGGPALVAKAALPGLVGYIAVDLDTGAVLDALNADAPLPPASVAKIPTALFALDAFGPDHRMETRLVAVGSTAGGVLNGDLILQGGGDPEADTTTLDRLVKSAVEAGLREVRGRFLVDDTLLPTVERIDHQQPEFAAYNPSVGPLNLNFNRVFTEWRRGGDGYQISVEARAVGLSPVTDIARVEVVDATTSGGIFDYADGEPTATWSVARAALGASGGRWLPVRRPADYAARVFRGLAGGAGLRLPDYEAAAAPLLSDVIARAEGRPLAAVVRDMLRHSTNLTAETLGLAAARARGGEPEDLRASAGAMNAWAAGFGGFPPGDPGFRLVNHSGLAEESLASARRMVELLQAADRKRFAGPQGGSATLRALLPERPYLARDDRPPPVGATLRAKTGTLNFVSALSGYIDTEAGGRIAFAIFCADMPARDRIRNKQIERPRGARAWAGRARRLQSLLIQSWIARFGTGENG